VKETPPSVKVDATTLGDGSALRLNFDVYSESGIPINTWEINWGDGKTSSFGALGDSLTAAHYYVPQGTNVSYNVTLSIRADTLNYEYWVYTFTSVGSVKSAESPIPATSGFCGPVFSQTKKKTISTSITPTVEATLPNAKTKSVFEELCETNWLDED